MKNVLSQTTFARCCVRVATDPSLTLARRLVLYRDNRLRSGSAHTTSAVAPSTFVIPVPTTGIVVRERRPGIRRPQAPYRRPALRSEYTHRAPAGPPAKRGVGQNRRQAMIHAYHPVPAASCALATISSTMSVHRDPPATGLCKVGQQDQVTKVSCPIRLRRLAPSSSRFPRGFPSTTVAQRTKRNGAPGRTNDDHYGLRWCAGVTGRNAQAMGQYQIPDTRIGIDTSRQRPRRTRLKIAQTVRQSDSWQNSFA